FMPLYLLGFMGMPRRMEHYDVAAWQPWLIVAFVGAVLILFGSVIVLVGRWRYRMTAIGIRDDEYRTHRRGLEVVWVGMIIVTAISIAFVLKS
ncbi:MAG: hypothetical protein KDC46_13600, partial [Thermoleophilia bacterium]|nr:hypothetical protein [Thermoleophilia bacterium]